MDKVKIKKFRSKTILLIVVIIGIIGGLRTFDDLKRNDDILQQKKLQLQEELSYKYKQELKNIQIVLDINGNLISKSKSFINSFKNKDREKLYELSRPLLNSLYDSFAGTPRIHFHTKEYISFLRVHEKDKFGDDLKNIRPMVSEAIKAQSLKRGYEHGKHDKEQITYRSAYPIFDKEKFLGVVEIGIDTSFINKNLEELAKKFFAQDVHILTLIKSDNTNFKKYANFDGKLDKYRYMVTEFTQKIFKHCDNTIKNQIVNVEDKLYSLELTNIELKNFKDEVLGNYFSIVDITNDVKQNNIFFYSSLVKPIIAAALIVALIWWIFNTFYKNFLAMEKRTRNIIDSQIALVVLSDGENLIDCNKALLEFYGFESIEEFKEKFECICNTFEKGESFLQKENNGVVWIEKLIHDEELLSKVAIKDKNGVLNIFSIVLNSHYHGDKNGSEYYVITLTNISDLERANAQLIEQSKQASLGEMIGNIAHQWRQPLSVISTAASGLKLKKSLDKLDDELFDEMTQQIVKSTQFLSNTIDIFRNFIKEKHLVQEVVLQDRIRHTLEIISATLKNNHIGLVTNIEEIEDIKIVMPIGELSQVLINIFNNANDAFLERKIEEPWIKLIIEKKKNKVVISVEDNAGGMDKEVLPKVFDPYFTTKHKAQGTGLGLHMSYQIIKDSLKGDIYVKNTKNGAKFFIELPINL